MDRSFNKFLDSPAPSASSKAGLNLLNVINNIWRNYKYLFFATFSVFLFLNFSQNTFSSSSSSLSLQQLYDLYPSFLNNNNTNSLLSSPPRRNVKDMFTIEQRLSYYFPYDPQEEIENNIWQLWRYRSDDKKFPSKCLPHIERWRVVNDNYNHNLISMAEAESLVNDYLENEVPEVVEALNKLPDERLKFEMLKYLVIYISGGLYADIDTICSKPMKFWYDSNLIKGKIFLGVSIDYNDENWEILYNRRLLVSNKLFRSKSHHPVLGKMIARITYMAFNQEALIREIDWNKAFENLDSNGEPLIQFTGESIFTDTLFEYLNYLEDPIIYRVARTDKDLVVQRVVGPEIPKDQRINYKLFSMAVGPTQVDDVVIMPEVTFRGNKDLESHAGFVEGAPGDLSGEYDDENQRKGDARFYYARSLNLLNWND